MRILLVGRNNAVLEDPATSLEGKKADGATRIDFAVKLLKRKLQKEGIFRELKRRKYYVKPSRERALQKELRVINIRRYKRKAQREI